MRVNNSRYCALLVACTLGMGNRVLAGDARRSVQATLILIFTRTKHESMQVNLKPRLDSVTLKSTKHECSYAGK